MREAGEADYVILGGGSAGCVLAAIQQAAFRGLATGIEFHRGRLVAYSLGNFATYGAMNLTGPNGLAPILEVALGKDGTFRGGIFELGLKERGVKIVTNAGGLNPRACRARMEAIAAEAGLSFKIAIVGRPNVGKSSLLNKLTGAERSVVSAVPGTTRDAIDTDLEVEGQKFQIIDTAGIRRKGKTTEMAEKLSVVMARKHIERADVVFPVAPVVEKAGSFAPAKVRDAKPDALFVFLPSGQGAAFMKQFAERGLDKAGIKLIGTGDITDDDQLNDMGDVALGVVTAHHYAAAHKSAVNQKFVEAFKKANNGMRPNFMAVGGYDGIRVIVEGLLPVAEADPASRIKISGQGGNGLGDGTSRFAAYIAADLARSREAARTAGADARRAEGRRDGGHAAFEVLARLGKQDRHLDREYFGSVKILVEPIVVAGLIGEKQGGRPGLAAGGTVGARRRWGIVAVGELFERRRADVHGVPEGTGLRPGLGHADDVRRYVAPDVLRGGVAYAGEPAAVLHLAGGLHYRHLPVLRVRDLQEFGVDRFQALAVGLVEEAGEEHELLSLARDHELLFHRPRLTSASR